MDLTPDMKIKYPGLLCERLPSGAVRYRVRVEGDKARRIPLSVAPDHPHFVELYLAARAGLRLDPQAPAEDRAICGSVRWLAAKHLTAMGRASQSGQRLGADPEEAPGRDEDADRPLCRLCDGDTPSKTGRAARRDNRHAGVGRQRHRGHPRHVSLGDRATAVRGQPGHRGGGPHRQGQGPCRGRRPICENTAIITSPAQLHTWR